MHQIVITMSQGTLQALQSSGFFLYAFKAVESSDSAGRPLVWFQSQSYSVSTQVMWDDEYQAYTSSTPIKAGKEIFAGFSVSIALQQTFEVQTGGTGIVKNQGGMDEIRVFNTTSTQYTTGISQAVDGKPMPLCAFPLYGGSLQKITPLDQVLLTFSTETLDPGSVIDRVETFEVRFPSLLAEASLSGLLVDLKDAPGDKREVSFDINLGWSWDGGTWAQTVPAGADLLPLLIQKP